MGALLLDFARVQHHDLVGVLHRGNAVRDDNAGALPHDLPQPLQNRFLGVSVYRRQRVIQNENLRPAQEGARNGGALLLAAGEIDPALAQHGVEPLGKGLNFLFELSHLHGPLHFGQRRPFRAKVDVGPNGVREQERILGHVPDAAAQHLQRNGADVVPVDEHRAGAGVDQARNQVDERGLAGAGPTHDGQGRAACNSQIDVLEHRRPVVRKRHVAKLDGAADFGEIGTCELGVADFRLGLENAVDARHGGRALLHQVDHPAERDHRPGEPRQVREKRHKLTQRDRAVDYQMPAESEHNERAHAHQKRHGRPEETAHFRHPQVLANVFAIQLAEPLRLGRFLHVRLDHAHAGQVFLHLRGDGSELRLNAFVHLAQPHRHAVHHQRHHRKRKQRQRRKLRIDVKHGADERQHGDRRVDGVHDRRAHHLTHRLQVVGGPRHQIPGFEAVKKGLVLRLQVCEQVVAQVVLDATRHADDGAAHEEQEQALHQGHAHQQTRVPQQRPRRDVLFQSVHRELQDPGAEEGKHVGEHHKRATQQKRSLVAGQILFQACEFFEHATSNPKSQEPNPRNRKARTGNR